MAKSQLSQKIVVVKKEALGELYPRSQRIVYGWNGFVALHKFFSDIYELQHGKDHSIQHIGYFRNRLILNNRILSDLSRKVKTLRTESKEDCPFELMHSVSTYPMKDKDANLRMIYNLRNRYNVEVGYSGHKLDWLSHTQR